ncbi:MAG: rod shape-determining protein RodA [Lachnospiraceae bacterium]|nr:rod shape-determining protein RodA [Lachnospiraceae bacterium]
MLNKLKQYDWKKFDYSLLAAVIILCILSAFAVRLAGGEVKGPIYMRNQFVGMILGLIIVAGLTLLDYHFICKFSIFYYPVGLLLTAATHSPIGTDNGTDARRWISLAGVTFQPVELMKIILIISLAAFFVKMRNRLDRVGTFIMAGALTALPVLLIMSQPDLSSSLVAIFIMVVLMVVAGVSYRILAPVFAAGIPLSLILFWYIQQPYNVILKPYQYTRIMIWLHPETDTEGLNMQQNRAVRAIASGGLTGKFIQDGGQHDTSRVYEPIPVNESDFIWSVLGEELGFLGCCFVLLLFAFVIFKCFAVAKKSQDYTGKLIAAGVASMFTFQVFANICVVTFIFPNTGLPLPFLSNGLSSMVSSMIAVGLVMNIGIQPGKTSKGGFSMRNIYGNNPTSNIDLDLEL